ncbi:MAG: sodium:alanine symporter family protein [Lachnospiraceae bacterium]|nr:sodium:alanine symporter family protein [Lachnospiraceae bacterium]
MQIALDIIQRTCSFLWSFPMLILLLGTHIYFTVRLRLIQKKVPLGIKFSFSRTENTATGITPYEALATALAATIGTGNIIGVSTAVAIGGPGAVFWCWITGILGIATCYAEAFLSVRYRVKNTDGLYTGGPMYILRDGLHMKRTAALFALFTACAALGIGSSVQANSICTAIREQVSLSPHIIGMTTAVIAGFVMLGGIKQIARVCTILVPFMSLFYLAGCAYLLLSNYRFVPQAILVIIRSAFSSRSFVGGMAGTAVMTGIRTGISKGLFTNEVGLGSIPIAAAASNSTSPARQGLISMTGPFWDTVVICAVTGIVIVSSMLRFPADYAGAKADHLCFIAFEQLPFHGGLILSVSLVLFAFATIIGWCYYGEAGVRYLTGNRTIRLYQTIYIVFIYLGAVTSLQFVFQISDLFNALMALPNLLCLWLLKEQVAMPETTCSQ